MGISQASIDALLADVAGGVSTADEAPDSDSTKPDASQTGNGASSKIPVQSTAKAATPQIERILGVSVPVAVLLAERNMPVEAILDIRVGTIVEFEMPFDSELALQVANRTIGHGQAVKVGENFGLRISHIGTVEDRIDAMGGK